MQVRNLRIALLVAVAGCRVGGIAAGTGFWWFCLPVH